MKHVDESPDWIVVGHGTGPTLYSVESRKTDSCVLDGKGGHWRTPRIEDAQYVAYCLNDGDSGFPTGK